MEIKSNFSITNLFATKVIKISVDNIYAFSMIARPVRDLIEDDKWNSAYNLLTQDIFKWRETLHNQVQYDEQLYYIQTMTFQLGAFKQYAAVVDNIHEQLAYILPGFEVCFEDKTWKVNDVTITPEIWNYVVYLLKLICGEKVQKPLIFNSQAEKDFYLKQQELENKIKKIKDNADNSKNADGLIKNMLSITYSFPSITIDYLFDQTLAQIHWLAKMAAQEVSYSVNAQAFAAGNMKKGKKLEFFIK